MGISPKSSDRTRLLVPNARKVDANIWGGGGGGIVTSPLLLCSSGRLSGSSHQNLFDKHLESTKTDIDFISVEDGKKK